MDWFRCSLLYEIIVSIGYYLFWISLILVCVCLRHTTRSLIIPNTLEFADITCQRKSKLLKFRKSLILSKYFNKELFNPVWHRSNLIYIDLLLTLRSLYHFTVNTGKVSYHGYRRIYKVMLWHNLSLFVRDTSQEGTLIDNNFGCALGFYIDKHDHGTFPLLVCQVRLWFLKAESCVNIWGLPVGVLGWLEVPNFCEFTFNCKSGIRAFRPFE